MDMFLGDPVNFVDPSGLITDDIFYFGAGAALLTDQIGKFLIHSWAQYRRGDMLEEMESNCRKAFQSNSRYQGILCRDMEISCNKVKYIGGARKLVTEGSQITGVYSSGSALPTSRVDIAGGVISGVIINNGK